MRILVTGAAGFIGTNFVRLSLDASSDHPAVERLVAVDLLTYAGNYANLADLDGDARFRFVRADIADREAMTALLRDERIDVLVNFAAESHVDRSIVDQTPFLQTNVHGTLALLDAARAQPVRRFLQVSTDEVYGSIAEGRAAEDWPAHPSSPYAASKSAADGFVQAYAKTFGVPAVITRCSNNYGPYQFPEKVIPLFTTNLLDGDQVPLYGDGGNIRDWLYVLDNVRAVDLVLRSGVTGEIYNVGAHNEITNRELAHKLLELTGRDESYILPVDDRLGHDRRYSITTDKITTLGWKPEHQLDAALERTVAWYRDNRAWWEPLKARAAFDRKG
jgi:dTDP-glucose 4,6-dehydratase